MEVMSTPQQDIVGWVTDTQPRINRDLEIVGADNYDESLRVPTYMYMVVEIRGKEVRLGIDTGSVRSLLAEEIYNSLNADYVYQLQPHRTQFEAVNGSQITCLGCVKLPVIFYGYDRHYKAAVQFFIIKDLELQGLLGIDEISRHGFNINMEDGTCFQTKVGRVHISVVFREDRRVRSVTVAEDVLVPPLTTCNIQVNIAGVERQGEGEGFISPRKDMWELGLNAGRVLTMVQPVVLTQVMNMSDNTIELSKGESFGLFNFTVGSPVMVSSVVENEKYAECLMKDEEMDDPMSYEEFETKKLEEIDFGLSESKLSKEQKGEVRNELNKFREVFQWDELPVSFTHKIKHKIELKPGARPVKQKNRKFSEEQNSFIDKEIQKLLRQDVVQPSQSNWSARIVLSREERKNRYRLCIDYRAVNALSAAPSAHPLPNIQEVMDQFRGQKYFHTLDLFQGYHQCLLEEESRPITAFSTKKGLFEYKRMPFGLNSCPTTYQSLMESILGELCWKTAVVYIDDVIVFGRTYEEARERLREVLIRLREAKLKLRASKVKLFQSSVEFLGFVISDEGIKTCRHIIDSVLNFPVPKNVKGAQRLLGIANYYRTFIKGHSKILEPIINLTRKEVAFEWTEQCQEALDTIKGKLTTAPVRNYYNAELPIVLTTDASGRGIGATLSQVSKEGTLLLLAFGSRVLKPSEYSWSTTEKECFAIVYFVKKFRHYLSKPFIIFSDHNSLRFVSTMRDSSRKMERWLNFLMQYSFEVHHYPGNSREMVVADILSRMMGIEVSEEEQRALRMEKPILRQYQGYTSPILLSWFRVEPPREDDFNEDNELISERKDEGMPTRERGSHLRIVLKRLQKEVEKEMGESLRPNCRWVSEQEVEYLN